MVRIEWDNYNKKNYFVKHEEKLHKCKITWGKLEIKHLLTMFWVTASVMDFGSNFFERNYYLDVDIII